MAFLKFTPTASAYTAAAHIRAGAIISVDERADGRGGRVQTAAGAYDVTESPDAILAAIAEAEGAPAIGVPDIVSNAMLCAALDVFQRAKIPIQSLVLEDAIAAALSAARRAP